MTAFTKNYELLPDLVAEPAPPLGFVNLQVLVPHLLDIYPEWALDELKEFLEEKTRKPIRGEEGDILSAIYHRCLLLRREFEG